MINTKGVPTFILLFLLKLFISGCGVLSSKLVISTNKW